MKKVLFITLFTTLMFAKVNVVASTTDLADIAKSIGGDLISVTSISKGNQNHHYVEVLPSYMLKVKKADIYLKVGLELDLWANQIIDGSRNRKLTIVNCSKRIAPLEVPTSKVDASMGDIHKMGNPHYWLDPENGKLIAKHILGALSEIDPDNKNIYENNYQNFVTEIDTLLEEWLSEFESLQGKEMIFYHNSWPYFNERFGLKALQFIEPKPGIMPSPKHLEKLLGIIDHNDIELIGMETYFSDIAPKFLSEKTGIKIVKLAQSVNAVPQADSYFNLFQYNLDTIANAFGGK